MKEIKVARFKGYRKDVSLNLDGNSSLVFGENGAGKTSLYEAIKIWFFSSKIKASLVNTGKTPEEREQAYNDYLSARQNQQEKRPFTIKINGLVGATDEERYDYSVYMISAKELRSETDDIVLGNIIPKLYFDDIDDTFLQSHHAELEKAVNISLKDNFSESIEIKIDSSDNYRCSVIDLTRNMEDSNNLSYKFNESKLHLIRLLVLTNIILLLPRKGNHKIIVFDDFVTSLDAANRAYVIKYILKEFEPVFQLLLLTHSAGFYNLCKFETELFIHQKRSGVWNYYCIYSIGDNCNCYLEKKNNRSDVQTIKEGIKNSIPPYDEMGNKLRQVFEMFVHKLARRLQTGGIEESSTLLNRIQNKETIYLKESENADVLVDKISNLINEEPYKDTELSNRLSSLIDEYSLKDFNMIKEALLDLQLFQKVALHPSSHGKIGLSPVSRKELDESIVLIEKLEKLIDGIQVHDESAF